MLVLHIQDALQDFSLFSVVKRVEQHFLHFVCINIYRFIISF